MERGSSHHAPRVDDELAAESASMLHGSVLSGRDREDLEPEVPAADEEGASPDFSGTDVDPDIPAHDEILARSELARWLLPSSFPARAATLAAVAAKQGAPDDVVTSLEAVTDTRILETVGDLWSALGGVHEQRVPSSTHERTDEPVVVSAIAPTGTVPVDSGSDAGTGSLADGLVHLITLPPRIALAAVREVGHVVGRGIASVTGSDHPSS